MKTLPPLKELENVTFVGHNITKKTIFNKMASEKRKRGGRGMAKRVGVA